MKTMTIQEALAEIGVHEDTLTPEEKRRLDEDGYVLLPGILSPAEVDSFRARTALLLQKEGDRAGLEVHQERGTDRLSDLVNKGPEFELCFTHPRVLAAISYVLEGDVKLSSLNYRAALPGEGHQGLHMDFGGAFEPPHYQVCNSLWLLDDFTPENGATRVVPETHRRGRHPHEEMADPSASHPDEVLLTAKAGDVVVVNSHTWHGGTTNRTGSPRRVLHSYFCRRGDHAQLDQQNYLRLETFRRLSEPARVVLGVK